MSWYTNRFQTGSVEGKEVIEMARKSKVITHLIPWDSNGSMDTVMKWINAGAIGKLTEVHNWTNRPVWPQYPDLPADKPPVPEGFDWDLWLGPKPIVLIILTIQTWYSVDGMISAADPWQIWAIIAYGQFLMHCN